MNVVDINTRECLESFLIVLDADKPLVDMVRPIASIAGAQNFYKLPFTNPIGSGEPVEFTLSSSDTRLIYPKAESITMQPKQEGELCFVVPA